MRVFYEDEGPIDTLLQVAERPVLDGDLVDKACCDAFVKHGWVVRCHGWNVITDVGENAVRILKLKRSWSKDTSEVTHDVIGDLRGTRSIANSRVTPGARVRWAANGGVYSVVAVDDDQAWIRWIQTKTSSPPVLGVVPLRELTVLS